MKTLVLFYTGCIEFEVMLACELVNSKYPIIRLHSFQEEILSGAIDKSKMDFWKGYYRGRG